MFKRCRLWFFGCSCLASIFLSGCVEGELRTLARYNSTNDSFVFLSSYTNVRGASKEQTDHLVSLWNRRESIVPFFAWSAFERRGSHGISIFDIGDPRATPEVWRLQTDLDLIKITPGEFYLNQYGGLSYFTEITVPGASVDSIIDEKSQDISSLLKQFGDDLVKKSSDTKNERATWNKTRQDLLTKMLRKPTDPPLTQTPREGQELPPFDTATVDNFIRAGANNSFKITRSKDVLSCVFPLSQADCNEAIASVDLMKENMPLALERHKGQSDEKDLVRVAEILNSVEVRSAAGGGLEVLVNLSRLALCLNRFSMENFEPKPNERDEVSLKATVAAISGRGIKINKQFSITEKTGEFPVK